MKRNLVGKIFGKIKIFVQDFVPIRTALMVHFKNYYSALQVVYVAFPEYFGTITVFSLYGGYVVRFSIPGGVFLPCDHGLESDQ